MRYNDKKGECGCLVGSVTQAMRAKNLLAAQGYRTAVVKADSKESGEGCAYALSYSCAQQDDILGALQNAGFAPRGIRGGDI